MRFVSQLPRRRLRPASFIVDGDSITFGFSCASGFRFSDLSQQYFPTGFGSVTNIAVSGETFAQMVTNQPANVYPLISAAHAAGKIAVCFCAGGTNDIGIGGASASTVLGLAQTYFENCKANGADLCVAWTILPRNNPGTIMSTVLTYNDQLRLQYKSFGVDLLIDAAACSQLDPTNASLCSDGLHWNTAGHGVLTAYYAPGMCSLLAPGPHITSVSPATGPHAGGTTVDIRGSGLAQTKAVALSGVLSASVTNIDDGHVRVTTAAGYAAGGPDDVAIMGPNGGTRMANAWTYT